MSDKKRYDEELSNRLQHLSLPDRNTAWEKMAKLLEEDDDRVVPPLPDTPSSNGNNMRWLLLLFLLVAGGALYFIFKPKQELVAEKNITAGEPKNVSSNIKKNDASTSNSSKPGNTASENEAADLSKEQKNEPPDKTNNSNTIQSNRSINKKQHLSNKGRLAFNTSPAVIDDKLVSAVNTENKKLFTAKKHHKQAGKVKYALIDGVALTGIQTPGLNMDDSKQTNDAANNIPALLAITKNEAIEDSVTTDKNVDVSLSSIIQASVVAIANNDSVQNVSKKKATDSSAVGIKKENSNKKFPHLAAGIFIQQPVQISHKSEYIKDKYSDVVEVSDYLPSPYARLYLSEKYFLQTEFKYAAPQYMKEFMYKSRISNVPYNFIVTTYILKKVYYHQLPVSIHCMVAPKLSVGVGITYNIFSSQATQMDVQKKPYGQVDSLISSVTLKGKIDSAFVSFLNNTQLLFESQYQWKRFSFGARYNYGLQPYIKYTNPFSNQPASKNKNSLNLFVRFELFGNKRE